MSNDDIDYHAERYLLDYDADVLKNPKPVDIEGFAEFYLNLTPDYVNLTHCGLILGRMVFNDSDKIPIYDVNSSRAEYISAERGTMMIDNTLLNDEHRLRSTMGHESGHWVLQQAYYRIDPYQMVLFDFMEKTATACRKSDIEGGDNVTGKRKFSTDHEWLEHQAKYFSAAILMPKSAMKIACAEIKTHYLTEGDFSICNDEVLAEQVAEIFNVSTTSAAIRIEQLGLGFFRKQTA